MAKSLTILLVDDHAVVRTGYRLLLSQAGGFEEVLEAETGEQAYRCHIAQKPSIVVMDLSLPGIGGLATIRKIICRDAGAKILVFSVHDELIYVSRALDAGAMGYITKSCAPEMLLQAVNRVAKGEIFIEPEIARRIAEQERSGDGVTTLSKLSAREFEVFSLIARGNTTQEVAKKLCLSIKTVANYNTQVKAKLMVKTSAELTRLAYRHGLF